jgi:hypothetical protein
MAEHEIPTTDSLLSELRAKGWTVAVHNDYRLTGVHHTFWLFTRGDVALKGEGLSDLEALKTVLAQTERHGAQEPKRVCYEDDGENMERRVYEAFLASFRHAGDTMGSLSHFQDFVQARWATNLRRALSGGSDFIWPERLAGGV